MLICEDSHRVGNKKIRNCVILRKNKLHFEAESVLFSNCSFLAQLLFIFWGRILASTKTAFEQTAWHYSVASVPTLGTLSVPHVAAGFYFLPFFRVCLDWRCWHRMTTLVPLMSPSSTHQRPPLAWEGHLIGSMCTVLTHFPASPQYVWNIFQ